MVESSMACEGHTIGFWRNRHGRALVQQYNILPLLPALCIVKRNGSYVSPGNLRQYRRWLRRANSWTKPDPAFSRILGEAGLLGMTWPKEYGGHERSQLERYVVIEELLAAGAPVGDADGAPLGDAEGAVLGREDGLVLGDRDGLSDGDALGLALGLAVGSHPVGSCFAKDMRQTSEG